MNTKTLFLILILALTQFESAIYAQTTYQFGGLPSFNLNGKLKNDWSLNTKIESRQLFEKGVVNGGADKEYKYLLTDLSMIAAKKVGLNSRIGGGYLIRFRNNQVSHRFIQQYIVVQKLSGFRLAHRFLSDQTFTKIEKPEFRLRYRISTETPLNGESVDAGEFYIKLNNEYVNSLQASEYDLEIRLVPLLGYAMGQNFKIESGLDYRVNSFLNDTTRHSYWMTLNLFIDI